MSFDFVCWGIEFCSRQQPFSTCEVSSFQPSILWSSPCGFAPPLYAWPLLSLTVSVDQQLCLLINSCVFTSDVSHLKGWRGIFWEFLRTKHISIGNWFVSVEDIVYVAVCSWLHAQPQFQLIDVSLHFGWIVENAALVSNFDRMMWWRYVYPTSIPQYLERNFPRTLFHTGGVGELHYHLHISIFDKSDKRRAFFVVFELYF